MEDYENPDWLREKYIVEDLTISEMADAAGVSDSTIYHHCKVNDVDTSPDGIDEEWLREKYVEEKKSIVEIADSANMSRGGIEYYMEKYGIESRDPHDTMMAGRKYTDKEWLHEKYIEEDLSTVEIAELCECQYTTISRHLKENGFTVEQPSGENHYNWKGGRSENPHTVEWRNAREKAIERDFAQCRSCGITRTEHKDKFNQDIEVHHRTPRSWYFKNYDENIAHEKMNELRNLITLCVPCHMQMERKIE